VKRLASLALLLTLVACDRGEQPKFLSHPAVDFTVQDGARRVALHDLRGQVVILNFWATWCPPCVEEMPSLVKMQDELKGDGVTVFAVSVDVDQDAYQKFIQQYDAGRLLVIRDPEQVGSKLYGTTGFPESYVIDRNGVVLRKLVGPIDWTSPDMMSYLHAVASGKTGATNSASLR
jgi:thiol-disulfide isomerase/thioredoxin